MPLIMFKTSLQLLVPFTFFTLTVSAQTREPLIELNQLGFYAGAPKVAIVDGYEDIPATNFFVITTNGKDTVFTSELSEQHPSTNSSLKTKTADFSAFTEAGRYYISVPGIKNSYEFDIKDNALHALAVASLKGFYFIRSSIPLEKKYAGKWSRPAGHPDTIVYVHPSAASTARPAGKVISSPGGWYDAGDYNKYVVNSGITTGTLLSAYEDFPSYFEALKTNITESGNKVPDILDEALYNIRWMLTMQDPNDGGVYHKCTNAAFDGMVMPGVTKLPRYVVQKSTAATLDFAAVMAQANRIFKQYNKQLPGFSDSCIKAARYAWQWAEKNNNIFYRQDSINKIYQPKITTGAYGDMHLADEWFWAATELMITTKEETYHQTFERHLIDKVMLPSWSNVEMLAYYTFIRSEKLLPMSWKKDVRPMKDSVVALANSYVEHIDGNAFKTVIGENTRDFIWGSNAVAANQSIVLINAYFITKDKKYIDAALANLDYILGRNATDYCFVTGLGTHSTMHPHHRPSVADHIVEPVPGLMAGGPNPGRQDKCNYTFTEPETAYTDDDCAYASNEIAINWNAPLVYVANAIEALQNTVGYSE